MASKSNPGPTPAAKDGAGKQPAGKISANVSKNSAPAAKLPSMQTASAAKLPQKSGSRTRLAPGLNVPDHGFDLKDGEAIYFFSAKHRGDMYHIRAWQLMAKAQMEGKFSYNPSKKELNKINAPLSSRTIIWDFDDKKPLDSDVVDYITEVPLSLGKFRPPMFQTSMTYDQISKESKTGTLGGSAVLFDAKGEKHTVPPSAIKWKSGFTTRMGESECTQLIEDCSAHFKGLVPARMVSLSDESFKQANINVESYFPPRQHQKGVAVLLWRNSRVPYPEMNTGLESAKAIATIMKDLGYSTAFIDIPKTASGIREQINSEGWASCSVSAYFEDENLQKLISANPKHPKRDIEAAFLKHAYYREKRCFDIVIGMRSGALDLMTFLGIPTVSIGLSPMRGDFRMRRLAGEDFQRVNVEYQYPRHPKTKKVDGRWESPDPQEGEGLTQPGNFQRSDLALVRAGVILALRSFVEPSTHVRLPVSAYNLLVDSPRL